MLHRFLGGLQDTDHSQSVLGIAQWNLAVAHALDEVLALELEWFGRIHARNQDVSKAHLNGVSVAANGWNFRVIVVDPQLL